MPGSPRRLEQFFTEIGQPVVAGTFLPKPVLDPDAMQRLQALAERYGQELFPPDYLTK